jgi:hypothetical protein
LGERERGLLPLTSERIGIRAYARHRNCAPSTVVKAVSSGRLSTAVQRDARGRPKIDAAAADREWLANTDPNMQRESQRAVRAGDVVPSWPSLVTLLGLIEEHVSAAFQDCVARTPEAPATLWERLYGDWGRLPPLLEIVQAQIIHAAHKEAAR